MPTTKKYKSRQAAVQTLSRFFADFPTADRLTVQEIFENSGREQKLFKANMAWLSNKLITLRYYNLVNVDYSYDGRRRLEGISLTIDGKRVLGRIPALYESDTYPFEATADAQTKDSKPASDDALKLVSELKKMYPELDITLTIRPKEA